MPTDPNYFGHMLDGIPFAVSNLPCTPQVTWYPEGGCRIDWINDNSGNPFMSWEVDENYRVVLRTATLDLNELLNVTGGVTLPTVPPKGKRPK